MCSICRQHGLRLYVQNFTIRPYASLLKLTQPSFGSFSSDMIAGNLK